MPRQMPYVKITFKDGGMGYIPATADGIPLFVGVSNQGTAVDNEVIAIDPQNKETVFDYFGKTDFANKIMDFFSAGGGICFAVKTSTATNQGILDALNSAIESLKTDGQLNIEFISVLAPADKTLASAIASYLESLVAEDIFLFAVLQTRAKKDTETTVDDYVVNLKNEWQGFTSKRIAVVASFANITNLTGKTRVDNIIGLVSGLIARAKVNQSIGEVRSFPVSQITSLAPAGINKTHLSLLNSAGFIVLTTYNGKKGYFIARENMFTDDTSDYNTMTNVRVANKAGRIIYLTLLDYENITVEPPDDIDPQNPPPPEQSPIVYDMQLKIENALSQMLKEKEIYGYFVEIPPNQNIWSSEKVLVRWGISPTPIIRYISGEHNFFNPMLRR